MLRPAPAVDVLPLLEEERTELVALLRRLSPEDFAKPTACEPWTVRDVAAHLLGVDLSLLSRLRDAYVVPDDEAPEGDDILAWIDRRNAAWVAASSWLSPGSLADILEHTGRVSKSFFGSLDPEGLGEEVSWASAGLAPWWLCVAREFSERWVHQQHIRDAVGAPGLNGPSFINPLLATLLRSLPHAYDSVPAGEGAEVSVQIEGRGGGSWAVVGKGDEWLLYEGRSKEPQATVALDQDAAWRFLVRNISEKEARKRAQTSGKKELIAPFFGAVAALVEP
jgi:uncharacterized protein (TIGR03083 family)